MGSSREMVPQDLGPQGSYLFSKDGNFRGDLRGRSQQKAQQPAAVSVALPRADASDPVSREWGVVLPWASLLRFHPGFVWL